MFVMQEPMKTSSTARPLTCESGTMSSGSLGQATRGSVIAPMSISITAAYSAPGSAASSSGSASQRSMASARRARVRASWYPASISERSMTTFERR